MNKRTKIVNLHTHSTYCDGTHALEAYVQQAIALGMPGIGFSSHAPIGFKTSWHMMEERLDSYIDELNALTEKYAGQIEVYKGLEVDFIMGRQNRFADFSKQLDFIIGSVHYVGQFEDQTYCCIDNTTEELERGLNLIYQGDMKQLVTAYYESVVEMLRSTDIDIIGHLDLIKKLNKDNRYFDEREDWYTALIMQTIAQIQASNALVEINTRGFYKGYAAEFYPSRWILKACLDANIPLTINSDAHHPKELAYGFPEVFAMLKAYGVHEYYTLHKHKWIKTSIV